MQENAISVSKLCGYIKSIFDSEELLHNISVYGEISGLSISHGNAFFDLKDEKALIPCVYFGIMEELKNGDKIIAVGSPNYYVKGGKLNFNVIKTTPFGLGEIYKKFFETKAKLESEGLFDESCKKELPKNIKRIGVVTSETGAVIQDIINIVTRRDDSVDIVLYPSSVQGIYAENEIISGIRFLDDYDVDVIVVARGGGSFEDLNVYNSERLARIVAECKKPIISAVGHETDYTIIDFVSDLRAPTPSAAAELLTKPKNDRKLNLLANFEYITQQIKQQILDKYNFIADCKSQFKSLFVNKIREKEYQLALIQKTLEKHNPKELLNKGYAFIEKDNKSARIDDLQINDKINIILKGGSIVSKIEKINKNWIWIFVHTKNKNRLGLRFLNCLKGEKNGREERFWKMGRKIKSNLRKNGRWESFNFRNRKALWRGCRTCFKVYEWTW